MPNGSIASRVVSRLRKTSLLSHSIKKHHSISNQSPNRNNYNWYTEVKKLTLATLPDIVKAPWSNKFNTLADYKYTYDNLQIFLQDHPGVFDTYPISTSKWLLENVFNCSTPAQALTFFSYSNFGNVVGFPMRLHRRLGVFTYNTTTGMVGIKYNGKYVDKSEYMVGKWLGNVPIFDIDQVTFIHGSDTFQLTKPTALSLYFALLLRNISLSAPLHLAVTKDEAGNVVVKVYPLAS